MFDTPFIIPVTIFVCWTIVSVVRAKHGYSRFGWHRTGENMAPPPMFEKMMDKAMAERDAEMQKLKERIVVLEAIVTDTHKSHTLSEEIEKLRERNGN